MIQDRLKNSSAKDARNALRAQLLATVLNLRNGADPLATGDDIQPVRDAAIALLQSHSTESLTSKNKDGHRQEALALKDLLDAYNNSGGG